MINQMTSFAPMDTKEPEPAAMALQPETFFIKRMGLRPLRFDGVELCMAMSFVAGAPMWFEINIYRRLQQDFVVCLKHYHRDEDEQDICRAWECKDFEAVMMTLETYDPARDLRVDVSFDDDMSVPDLAAHALGLRARAAEARRQYSGLVGEILFDLERD
jgi:hypothetical protein